MTEENTETKDPLDDFIFYRRKCIIWLSEVKNKSDKQIAKCLCMDETLVTQIRRPDIKEFGWTLD